MVKSSKMKKTKRPGVYRLPDGRFRIKVAVRSNGRHIFRQRTMAHGATLEDASIAAAILKKDANVPRATTAVATGGKLPPATDLTLEQYARRWIAQKVRRMTHATAEQYVRVVAERILPRLGFMRCTEITREAVQAWVGWAETRRKNDGSAYARATLRSWWRPLCTLLRDMSADVGTPDPTRRVRPPDSSRDHVRERRTLSVHQLWQLVLAARDMMPTRHAELATLVFTGARPGEVYGLHWDSVSFDAGAHGELVLKRAVSLGELSETTKTKVPRTVPMHPYLADALRQHRKDQLTGRSHSESTGLVFPSIRGTLRTPNTLGATFRLLSEHLRLDVRLGCQVIRRSVNTNALEVGADRITIWSIIGHNSEQMTRRYAGVRSERKTALLLGLFGEGPPDGSG